MKLFDSFFIGYLLILFFVKISRFYGVDIGIINSYLTDLIAVPTMSHLGSYLISKIKYNNQIYTYPLSYLLITATVLSILMEFIMPKKSPNYVGDYIDCICYFLGILIYQYWHKPYILKRAKQLIEY